MLCPLLINGFDVQARFDEAAVNDLFLPFLRALTAMSRGRDGRLVAFLAAPPAAGKSTLAAFLEKLSRETDGLTPVQALGMDGFHFHQDYILGHTVVRDGVEIPMKTVKGAPDTFDVMKLDAALRALKHGPVNWPFYDRRLHDVVEDAVPVTAPVVIVEGNWLLLNRPVWRDLPRDVSAFVTADESLLRGRLIARKERGGLSHDEALAFYDRCDGPNVRLCLSESLNADRTWRMTGEGRF